MRLRVWSPLPPSPSGIADYVCEQLTALSRRAEVTVVVEEPARVQATLPTGVQVASPAEAAAADLDVYHVGNSPAHAYVYRAALARPGVVVLHEWSLHHLILHETVERGDVSAYLHEMRRAHGETGTFVARQVARGLGGDLLPALFPLSERLLEGSLAVVGLTDYVASRAAARLSGRPVLRLSHHFSLPLEPSREDARRTLGLPADALLVTAPGLATAYKGLDLAVHAVARLRQAYPNLRLVVAGELDPRLPLHEWAKQEGLEDSLLVTGRLDLSDFVRHLAASDVVLALRFPTHGEMSGAVVRALGLGRPVLVTAGTPPADEFPEGVVVPVDPGPRRQAHLEALLDRLLSRPDLRETIGALARAHVRREHDLTVTVDWLFGFLEDVRGRRDDLERRVAALQVPEDSLLGYLLEEARGGARELGLTTLPPGVAELLAELLAERP